MDSGPRFDYSETWLRGHLALEVACVLGGLVLLLVDVELAVRWVAVSGAMVALWILAPILGNALSRFVVALADRGLEILEERAWRRHVQAEIERATARPSYIDCLRWGLHWRAAEVPGTITCQDIINEAKRIQEESDADPGEG